MAQFNFDAIGTKWQIDIYNELSKSDEDLLFSIIIERINAFDKNYSRFRNDSLIMEMFRNTGEYILENDAKMMMDIYYDLYLKTDGHMTPLIGNLLSDAGYDMDYTLEQKRELIQPFTWNEAIEYRYPKLIIKKPVILDFGALGKGHLIDIVSELIEKNGYNKYCIDAGGDIYYKGDKELKVGLENPNDFKQIIGICNLKSNKSICGSAGNRRVWGNFNHIMNPFLLNSPANILAIWTVADKAIIADALATALYFISPEKLLNDYKFEYFIVYKDNSFNKSNEF